MVNCFDFTQRPFSTLSVFAISMISIRLSVDEVLHREYY